MAEGGRFSQIAWSAALAVAGLVLGVLLLSLLWQVVDSRPDGGGGVLAILPSEDAGEQIVQVEIRNGVGTAGLAAEMTAYLRRRGFDVVASGNWRAFDVAETRVIDRVGNPGAAARVARSLGLEQAAVEENLDERLFVDVTVVIGHDYARLTPFRNKPSP